MDKTLVFIDAGFLSKVTCHLGDGTHLKYDMIKFAKYLTGKEKLIFKKLFYYNAPPFQSNKPTKNEKKRKEDYDSFITKISRYKEIEIKEGRLQRVKEDGKYVFKQKGVDTLITMDLMDVPLEYPKIKKIILIATDSDFVPIIKRLEKRGIDTILYTYFDKNRKSKFSTANQLLKCVKKYVKLKKEDFENCRFN